MRRYLLILATFTMLAGYCTAEDKTITVTITTDPEKSESKSPFTGNRPTVDVAILLDTSNSMDGLIKQAKTQLWTIVQQFADAKKQGKTPSLRVALFEYGNSRLPASEGYIRQVIQLTDDLDALSEALFSLQTRGGDEYCGHVINEAIARLDWSHEPNAYKAIFIAGNEPFTQGPDDYRQACRQAIDKGVVVNTIHCGSYAEGVQGKWEEGAKLAEGKYLNIDQDEKVIHIKCPQDKLIIELNAKLNQTYLWYGKAEARAQYQYNQVAQDANAEKLSETALLGRIAAKGGGGYGNAQRDLVDAYAGNREIFQELDEAELPEVLQKLSAKQRQELIESMTEKRKSIQVEIAKLNRERLDYIAKQKADLPQAAPTFGDAVKAAVQEQLEASGFEVR